MRAPALAVLTFCASLGVAGVEARPDWKTALERAGIRFISARDLHTLLTSGARLALIDARDEIHFQRGHIPGAVSIPAEDRPLAFVDIARPKRLFHPERLPADRNTLVVFYCGGPN
jgi:rhodanese-related sulfurtransferase